ncbi:hypothetical protein ACLI1M_001157 [Corynebacterium sp. LaCa54]|uniref:hypothetical protein n=1 Tax=Corynebacterium sp. LaCa54 TaxID=3391428 RepID=UPI003988B776
MAQRKVKAEQRRQVRRKNDGNAPEEDSRQYRDGCKYKPIQPDSLLYSPSAGVVASSAESEEIDKTEH